MVKQSLKSFSFESKLNEDESNYQRAAAKNYLAYFGNIRPNIEQLEMMQSLIDSHWLNALLNLITNYPIEKKNVY